mmetsp:Transcript_2725/g.11221  ORF Transcript_2725/g.11221 Transcript_2725/m.11221 type:complete len:238 (+) Transcript_2725:669-1382(+)
MSPSRHTTTSVVSGSLTAEASAVSLCRFQSALAFLYRSAMSPMYLPKIFSCANAVTTTLKQCIKSEGKRDSKYARKAEGSGASCRRSWGCSSLKWCRLFRITRRQSRRELRSYFLYFSMSSVSALSSLASQYRPMTFAAPVSRSRETGDSASSCSIRSLNSTKNSNRVSSDQKKGCRRHSLAVGRASGSGWSIHCTRCCASGHCFSASNFGALSVSPMICFSRSKGSPNGCFMGTST